MSEKPLPKEVSIPEYVMMENAEDGNDILGSVYIDIPQKEFDKIEVTGEFSQISLYTINSDVLIHANNSFANLDLEADQLEHNITLEGSESNIIGGMVGYVLYTVFRLITSWVL